MAKKFAFHLSFIRIYYQQYKDPTIIYSTLKKLISIGKIRYEGLKKTDDITSYVIIINSPHLSRKAF